MAHAYVYLLESGGYYKIGYSYKPWTRVKRLATGSPVPIRLVHQIRTEFFRQVERKLHERFASRRLRGEWFDLNDDDIAHIKSVNHLGQSPKEAEEWERFCREEPEQIAAMLKKMKDDTTEKLRRLYEMAY